MKILKNYLYNIFYQVLSLIVPIVTTPYIARVLQVDGVGKYTVTLTIIEYFVMFGMLGVSSYGSREIAYVRDDRTKRTQTFWDINYSRFITMGISLMLFTVYLLQTEEDFLLYLAQGVTILASLVDISWYYTGVEKFKSIALKNVVVKIISVALIFIFVKSRSDLILYATIISGSLFVGQLILWLDIKKEVDFVKPIRKNAIIHLKGCFKLWLPTIAASVYTSFDKIMLDFFTNEVQVGLYANSQKIVKIAATITTGLSVVTMPKVANSFYKGDNNALSNTVEKSIRAVSFIAFPMAIGIMSVRRTLVPWFLGPGYEPVSNLLLISSFLIITLSWSSILANQVFVATGKEHLYTLAIVLAAVINLGLNIVLIPRFYAAGALFSSVFAEYIGMFIMLYFSREYINIKRLVKTIFPYALTSFIMYIPTYFLGTILLPSIMTTGIQVTLGAAIYLICMIALKDEIMHYILGFLLQKKK